MPQIMMSDARIGIINRGEAAVRAIGAIKEYNFLNGTHFSSVAFYMDCERHGVFVKQADRSFPFEAIKGYRQLTGSPYLAHDFLVTALKKAECSAVWVGWGFLAEDPLFAAKLEQAGIVLLGPSATSMAMLGDKIEAKNLAITAEVPTLPWSGKPLANLAEAQECAERIGYPVILKAANGGGGRGIRKVLTPEDLPEAFQSVADEIQRFFGNRIIFMEALVVRGRHLEVQCVADYHGHVLTFGVRDCSVQRNNQKIIEETPPPHLADAVIERMEQASQRLLKAADYWGAATVEYFYDCDRQEPYFMEVNTRLQVEHPITEELYQVDLVHLQIAVALGHKLADFVKPEPRGYVSEVRLNAEDPDQNFAPTPGKVLVFAPTPMSGIRIDSGIETGSVIPKEFDSMVAKIIAKGPTRVAAHAKLRRALEELTMQIEKGTTNKAFLLELLNAPEVQEGGVQTDFVERFIAGNHHQKLRTNWEIAIIAGMIFQYREKYLKEIKRFTDKINVFAAPRQIASGAGEFGLAMGSQKIAMTVRGLGYRYYHLTCGTETLVVKYAESGSDINVFANDCRYPVQIVPRTGFLQCEVAGVAYPLGLGSAGDILASSPAVVLKLFKQPGDQVQKGERILTLEAMKMEMAVKAPAAGVIKMVHVNPGEQVQAGQCLAEVEAAAEDDAAADKTLLPPLDFAPISLPSQLQTEEQIIEAWYFLRREFLAHFLGHDAIDASLDLLAKIEIFVGHHPEYREKFCQMVLIAIKSYTDIENLFAGQQFFEDQGFGGGRMEDLIVHFLRSQDRDDIQLPEDFANAMERAFKWYVGAELSEFNSAARILYHIYRSHKNLAGKTELIKSALEAFRNHYPHCSQVCPRDELADILNGLIRVNPEADSLVDRAFYTRYELVDRLFIEEVRERRQNEVAEALVGLLATDDPVLRERKVQELSRTGHQIVTQLLAHSAGTKHESDTILEIIGRRFNRDRRTGGGQVYEACGIRYYSLLVKEKDRELVSLSAMVDPEQVRGDWQWLKAALAAGAADSCEVICLVRNVDKHQYKQLLAEVAGVDLELSLLTLGFEVQGKVIYHSYLPSPTGLQLSTRRQSFSPLRYRELRLKRLDNFDLKLLYHSDLVHLVEARAYDNPKDERLLAFIEIPEVKLQFNESGAVKRMLGFEDNILDALQAMRQQQTLRKRRLLWNRIIVHIGRTLPINLEKLGDYPKLLTGIIHGTGVEKMVIYTKIPGRTQDVIDTEVLFENLTTKPSIRGRIPSQKHLQPLNSYDSKVLRCMQRGCTYPYEVIRMITKKSASDFPAGEFTEYEITVSAGDQATVRAERGFGENTTNIVFGVITNTVADGRTFERVLVVSDPSRDLGSLAEGECRRIIAAIDLAWQMGVPLEWVPVSSGAAIGMNTGTENLDWTAAVLAKIVAFTQAGGEINVIVDGINVGAQSYWNAEATMMMHNRGILIMTRRGSMLLTGKKALDFSGSVSADDNIGIGGVDKIMAPNGQAQYRTFDLEAAYHLLFRHYKLSYSKLGKYPTRVATRDPISRDITDFPYHDSLGSDFSKLGDILGVAKNAERKKPFDMRQLMKGVQDQDCHHLERWANFRDAENAIVWQSQLGGHATCLIGIESRQTPRLGDIPNDGPESWTAGTLYPQSSRKVARAINSASGKLPVVVLANLSGFDGSPESLRKWQLEYGAEIGRAVVNFRGPLVFVVVSRYHGGAYVVFSKKLNPTMTVAALENTYASVIGGAPAAAVVFPRLVLSQTLADERVKVAEEELKSDRLSRTEYRKLFEKIRLEHQAAVATKFEGIHTVERAREVGSIDAIIKPQDLRRFVVEAIEKALPTD